MQGQEVALWLTGLLCKHKAGCHWQFCGLGSLVLQCVSITTHSVTPVSTATKDMWGRQPGVWPAEQELQWLWAQSECGEYHKFWGRGRRYGTAGRHLFCMCLTWAWSSTPHMVPWNPAGQTPEHRAKSKPWALPNVSLPTTTTTTKKVEGEPW